MSISTIKVIEKIELSNGYARIIKLGNKYSFSLWNRDTQDLQMIANINLARARELLADSLKNDTLEIS
jgi:hypothetical protein